MKEFIDEYKHLEKLCNEIYAEQHGVTLYINEMEQKSSFSTNGIPNWDADLEYLKRVRHIRNNLVHESDYDIDYTESDISFIKDFYQRILNQQDPLALLRKQAAKDTRPTQKPMEPELAVETKHQPQESNVVYQPIAYDDDENDSNKGWKFVKGFLIGVGILAFIGLLLMIAKYISMVHV